MQSIHLKPSSLTFKEKACLTLTAITSLLTTQPSGRLRGILMTVLGHPELLEIKSTSAPRHHLRSIKRRGLPAKTATPVFLSPSSSSIPTSFRGTMTCPDTASRSCPPPQIRAPTLASEKHKFLDSDAAEQHLPLEEISSLLTNRIDFDTRRGQGNVIERHQDDWVGIHLDSLKAPLSFPFSPFLLYFLKYYEVLPGQISPNAHRILACFPQIYAQHDFTCSIELFRFLFSVWALSSKHGGGFLIIQSWGHHCSITHLPDNNKGWKD